MRKSLMKVWRVSKDEEENPEPMKIRNEIKQTTTIVGHAYPSNINLNYW